MAEVVTDEVRNSILVRRPDGFGTTREGRGNILVKMRRKTQWITALFGAVLMVAPMTTFALPAPQSAKQDMKNAGRDTKDGAKDAGKGIEKGTKRTYHTSKRDTKKAWHKTKNTTKGAVNGAKQGAQEPHQN